MLSFREFLLLEDIGQDSESFGDVLHPSSAGDYMYAVSDPIEFWWLQWRWEHDKKIGRKFHGLDPESIQKVPYVTLQSTDMPDLSDKPWKHKKGNNPSQKVEKVHRLSIRGFGKHSKDNKLTPNLPYFSVDGDLEHYFKDKHSGKWPEQAADTDWTR